ncbi:MAG TPA: winged helix-turn-helix domain-containing protein [Chloroflexia bacterium]|nr:winged helix-turn-helix domain-containing protein [Chloroflexia bacterium]
MDNHLLPAYIQNRGLFAEAYLAEQLAPSLPMLPGTAVDRYTQQQMLTALREITGLWWLMRARMSHDEEEVRDFLRNVYKIFGAVAWGLRSLGQAPPTPRLPDLTIFRDSGAAARAAGSPKNDRATRYSEALTAIKLTRLNAPLDAGPAPATAIGPILDYTGLPWGILTDGGRWRLYARDAPGGPACYLEIDLEAILGLEGEAARQAAFRWFYAFFRPEAAARPDGRPFLDALPRAIPPPGAGPYPLTFIEAAEQVLAQAGGPPPLHYRTLTERALALGLVTHGRTPATTMYALILREIKQAHKRGVPPRFTRPGPGLVGLARWGK